jgi:hypothetical protein
MNNSIPIRNAEEMQSAAATLRLRKCGPDSGVKRVAVSYYDFYDHVDGRRYVTFNSRGTLR